MPKIKMLTTEHGADNGHHVKEYLADETYEVGEDLARCFLSTKSAEIVVDNGAPAPVQTKKKK